MDTWVFHIFELRNISVQNDTNTVRTKNLFLTLDRVSLHQSGIFSCQAKNEHGEFMIQSELDVQIPPKISFVQAKLTVEADQTAVLPCRVSGLPSPDISWSKSRVQLVTTQETESGRYSLVSGGSLVIEAVRLDDNGAYICHAKNEAGEDYQKIVLNVVMKAKIEIIRENSIFFVIFIRIFLHQFFFTLFFLHQFFFTLIFLHQFFFTPIFLPHFFFTPIFFYTNFVTPIFLYTNLLHQFFFKAKYLRPIFLLFLHQCFTPNFKF